MILIGVITFILSFFLLYGTAASSNDNDKNNKIYNKCSKYERYRYYCKCSERRF